jgi:ornithine decarboxylase
VRLVREALGPDAVLCFMHPVKPAAAISEAYHVHGVRTFSLDTVEELEKIVEATRAADGTPAADLSLCVRLRVSSEYSELSLASKFGVDLADAAPLLQATRQVADCLGICFHVGSQAMTPFAYVQALERARAAIVDAAVTVDIIDVGGGFPRSIPAWSRRRSRITSPRSTAPSNRCRCRTRRNCGASRAVPCRPSSTR